MREDMTAHSRDGNSAGDLKVVFADLNIDQPTEVGSVFDAGTFVLAPAGSRCCG